VGSADERVETAEREEKCIQNLNALMITNIGPQFILKTALSGEPAIQPIKIIIIKINVFPHRRQLL
jgi:hypothetical protein